MSRRESRDSESNRHRSRSNREPSPKRSRRDETERLVSNNKDLEVREVGTETDKKPVKSLRDALPLEPDEKTRSERPRSRLYHQHDDRRTTTRDGRRIDSERGSWRSSRDENSRRISGDDRKDTWRHDRFHESDDNSRKRPAFSEKKKIPEESRNNNTDTNLNDRNWRSNLHSDRHERPVTGRDRAWNRDDERGRGSFRQGYRADRDGFNSNGRSGFHGSWTKDEKKWDHDLFEEANKSPARATEEEQIAKVEAMLAS